MKRLLFLILILNISCKQEREINCPFKTLEAFSEETKVQDGVINKSEISIDIISNLKAFGKVNFNFNDSLLISNDYRNTIIKRSMNYSTDQILEHNKIIGLICGTYISIQEGNIEDSLLVQKMIEKYYKFLFSTQSENVEVIDSLIITTNRDESLRINEGIDLRGKVKNRSGDLEPNVEIIIGDYITTTDEYGRFNLRVTSREIKNNQVDIIYKKGNYNNSDWFNINSEIIIQIQ